MTLATYHEFLRFPTKFNKTVLLIVAIWSGMVIIRVPPQFVILPILIFGLACIICISPVATFGLILIIVPLRALILTEAPDSLPFDLSPVLVLLPLVSILTSRTIRKQQLFTGDLRVTGLVTIFIFSLQVSGIVPASILSWGTEFTKWVLLLIVVYSASSLGQDSREWLLLALCIAAVANAIVGIYIFLGGSGALHLLVNGRFFRAFGTFGQPNPFGGFMGLVAPIAIAMTIGYGWLSFSLWHRTRSISYKLVLWTVVYGFSSGFIIVGVFVSWSRGAWMGFVASIMIMVFSFPQKWWQRAILTTMVCLFVATLWSSDKIPTTIIDRINSSVSEIFSLSDVRAVDITSENYPIVERLAHWQAALNMFESNFWFGVGAGNYKIRYEDYRLINWDEPLGHAHNYYLNVLGEAGIIGLITYLFMLGSIFAMTWQTIQHPDMLSRMAAIGLLGTWTYLVVHSLTDNLYVNNLYFHIGLMLGMLGHLNSEVRKMRISKYE